jgi:hypothetical protein
MTGGLTELVCKGQLDNFINQNPSISYYKFAYKKHTNFSFESRRLEFETNPLINKNNIIYSCKIERYADLISNLYFIYKLPNIYSDDKLKFRWVKNVGTLLIKRATLTIDSSIIDLITGEWLLIQNEYLKDLKNSYNELTGNVKKIYEPRLQIPLLRINNNKYTDISYPIGSKSLNKPSIEERQIIIPLSFNFTKNPSLSLMLVKLQLSDVYINIELEDIENLYQVYSDELKMFISPKYYNELYSGYNNKIDINTFITNNVLLAYIEANYIFLDNDERALLMTEPINQILIEQNFISNFNEVQAGNRLSTTIKLTGANFHIKEIIWTLRRNDYNKFNNNMNFTNTIPEDLINPKPIMDSAVINFDKVNRIQEKNADFFNKIQPYQHHDNIPKSIGIYSYSSALNPDKWFPTGSYDGSCLTTSLTIFVNPSDNSVINNLLKKYNKPTYNYNYLLRYYVRGFNVLEYNGGVARIKYS